MEREDRAVSEFFASTLGFREAVLAAKVHPVRTPIPSDACAREKASLRGAEADSSRAAR
jgi:hypothetical protein